MATNKKLFACGFAKSLKEQQDVDVQLKAKDSDELGKSVLAHKLILSTRSEEFKMMMDLDKIKASTKLETITFSELEHKELEALVEFIYSDSSILSENGKKHIRALYIAADKYEIPHLRDLCRIRIIECCRMDLTYAFTVLDYPQIPFDEDLNYAVFDIIKENISTASSHPQFTKFVAKLPIFYHVVYKGWTLYYMWQKV